MFDVASFLDGMELMYNFSEEWFDKMRHTNTMWRMSQTALADAFLDDLKDYIYGADEG